jgi:hypothetical protein
MYCLSCRTGATGDHALPQPDPQGCAHLTSLKALTDLRLRHAGSVAVETQGDEDGVGSHTVGVFFSDWIKSMVRAATWLQFRAVVAATAAICCLQLPVTIAYLEGLLFCV